MAENDISKVIDNIRGIDRSVSVLTKPVEHAVKMLNCVKHPDGVITWRPGYKPVGSFVNDTDSKDIRGLHNYEYYDTDSGGSLEQVIGYTASGTFVRKTEETITIGYSGGATTVTLDFYPVSGSWALVIKEDGVESLSETYDSGTEPSIDTLADLVADINGLTGFTCAATYSVSADTPASVFPLSVERDITSGASLTYYGLEEIETPDLDIPYNFSQVGFKNPTFLNENSICYIATGGYLAKYDGHQIARVGVPRPKVGIEVSEGSGGALSGKYYYYAEFQYHDKTGLVSYSALSPSYSSDITEIANSITVASKQIDIEIPTPRLSEAVAIAASSSATNTINISTYLDWSSGVEIGDNVLVESSSGVKDRTVTGKTATTLTVNGSALTVAAGIKIFKAEKGFRFAGGSANGSQSSRGGSGAAITVDTGHSLIVGDTVFISTSNLGIQKRTVTAVTSTTVTVDGSADMSIADDASVYANFKVVVYRTKANGSELYKCFETLPELLTAVGLESFSTISVSDNTADSLLGDKYIAPERDPDPAPKLSWITFWDGQLVGGGGGDNPSTLFFSQQDDLTSWPVATNGLDLQLGDGGPLTAGADVDSILYVFKANKRAAIAGTLYDGAISIEVFNDGIGCTCQNSIQEIPNGLIFMSLRGIELLTSEGFVGGISSLVREYFRAKSYTQIEGVAITSEQESLLSLSRVVSFNDTRNSRVIYYIPAESGTPGTDIYPNDNSLTLVFDYLDQNLDWYEWQLGGDLNFYGGMCLHRGQFLAAASIYDSGSTDTLGVFFAEMERGDKYDIADNLEAITQKLTIGWEDAGEPSVSKNYNDINIWQIKQSVKVPHTLTVKTYRNFNESTSHSNFTMDFTDVSYIKQSNKLRTGKADSLAVEMTNNTLHEGFSVNGLELDYRPVYNNEMTKRNG